MITSVTYMRPINILDANPPYPLLKPLVILERVVEVQCSDFFVLGFSLEEDLSEVGGR